jgi:hypothetical protein
MRRSSTIFATVLAAAALAAPASATVTPDADSNLETWSSIPQWVAPWPVANDDQSFTLAPNTTQTFTTPIPEAAPGTLHILVPCWGYDIIGPGVDMAVGGVGFYGTVGSADYDFHGTRPKEFQQAPNGDWFLPEPVGPPTPWQLKDGELCRKIGWSLYVTDPAKAGGAYAAAARKAKRTRRNVRVAPRKPKGIFARKANAAANGGVTVELAGVHHLPSERIELVVRVTTGDLAGPTTLYTHARVLLQR